MNVLVLGGTRFIGPHVVAGLLARGHEVTVFHRGKTESAPLERAINVRHVHGDFNRLDDHVAALKPLRPELIVHMAAFTRAQAETLMRCARALSVSRVVVPSSQDVYRAFGRIHRTEPGEPDPTPLTEDAPLRERPSVHGEEHDKRWVEEVVMSDLHVAGTVLRYPATYGPGDYRMYELTRRMFDARPVILLEEANAAWRWTHAYVENIAHATVLAVSDPRAAGRIYNVGEEGSPPKLDRVRAIGRLAGWQGKVVALPDEQMPEHLRAPLDWRQDWVCDSSRIRADLGYREVVSHDDGVRRMLEWQRANPQQPLDAKAFDYAAEDAAIAAL